MVQRSQYKTEHICHYRFTSNRIWSNRLEKKNYKNNFMYINCYYVDDTHVFVSYTRLMLALTVDNSRKRWRDLFAFFLDIVSSSLLCVLNVFTLSRVTQRTLILLSISLCVLWSLTHKWIRTQEIVEIRACFSSLIIIFFLYFTLFNQIYFLQNQMVAYLAIEMEIK